MMVRPLKVETGGYSWVGLTIPIKAVFLPALCPALLQCLHFHGTRYAKTIKRQYKSANRDARRCLLSLPVADRAPHRGRPDASGESNLIEHHIQPIAQGDDLLPRHLWLPLLPQGVDRLREPCSTGVTRRHLLDSSTKAFFLQSKIA